MVIYMTHKSNNSFTGKDGESNYSYRYRIILVDDEEEIRDGIREAVNWNHYGFDFVAEASNGQEALELARTTKPGVVITDICMPFMSGLELCQNLRKLFPEVCLVILSGYDDFEYAQKAIQTNVEEYILKAVNYMEFTALLERIRSKLDERLSKQYDMERLKEWYDASIPALREQFLVRLIGSKVHDAWAVEQAHALKLDLSCGQWTIGLIRSTEVVPNTERSGLLPYMVQQLAEKELPKYCPVTVFLYQDYVAVLASLDSPNAILQLMSGLRQICVSAHRFLKLDMAAGIGVPCTSLCQLRRSASEAENALGLYGGKQKEPQGCTG